jgi:LacI family transcriptional regulator/LacI family repressor for deo operon, udp, cdd, tsx, nupC, and nupG
MKTQRATINDVARQAGVSKATVSAVLNDTGSVSGGTRDRVLAAIDVLNYRPTQLSGRAGARKTKAIGLLIKEIDNPYYAEVVLGVRSHAIENGYTLLVASSEGEYDAERRAVELLQAKAVEGIVATPVLDEHADLSHFFELKRRNFPFVLLEEVRGVPASLVDVDNRAASRRGVEYLIRLGHTRIVHFAGPAYSMHSQERIDGVRQACSASHLIFTDDDIVPAGAHLADGYRAALTHFRKRPAAARATAVTCYNDLIAIGVCRALAELGLRVPEDVSIVGFDDIPMLEYLPVPLTTIRVPKFEMGKISAQMLVRHIESKAVVPPQKVVLAADLIVRRSTRALDGAPAVARMEHPADTASARSGRITRSPRRAAP